MAEVTPEQIKRAADSIEQSAATARRLGYNPSDPVQVAGAPHIAGPINEELRRRRAEREEASS